MCNIYLSAELVVLDNKKGKGILVWISGLQKCLYVLQREQLHLYVGVNMILVYTHSPSYFNTFYSPKQCIVYKDDLPGVSGSKYVFFSPDFSLLDH